MGKEGGKAASITTAKYKASEPSQNLPHPPTQNQEGGRHSKLHCQADISVPDPYFQTRLQPLFYSYFKPLPHNPFQNLASSAAPHPTPAVILHPGSNAHPFSLYSQQKELQQTRHGYIFPPIYFSQRLGSSPIQIMQLGDSFLRPLFQPCILNLPSICWAPNKLRVAAAASLPYGNARLDPVSTFINYGNFQKPIVSLIPPFLPRLQSLLQQKEAFATAPDLITLLQNPCKLLPSTQRA